MSVIAQDGRQEKHKEDGVNTWKKRFRLFKLDSSIFPHL